jgi:hypothetical protein
MGTFTYANGDQYTGMRKNDAKHGKGVHTFVDGSHYNGGFQHGKKDGYGTITGPNGDQFTGRWKDGLKHGNGVCTIAVDGNVYDDIYLHGNMISKQLRRQGSKKRKAPIKPERD